MIKEVNLVDFNPNLRLQAPSELQIFKVILLVHLNLEIIFLSVAFQVFL